MASANPSYNELASSTLRNYKSKLIENLIDKQAFFWQLNKRNMIDRDQGGTSITSPILHGLNSGVSSYSGYDPLDVTPQAGISSVELDWKFLAVPITISGEEELRNASGRTRIFSLLEAKIMQAEKSLQIELNTQLFGDGTGNGGKDLTGLDAAVEDGTAWGTYGGINSDTHSFWRNQWLDFDGTYTSFDTDVGKSVEGISAIRNMANSCTVSGERPTLIITSQTLYEAYESYVEGDKYRTMDRAMADVGFTNVAYGGIPMIWDSEMRDDEMLFLNSNYAKLVVARGRDFTSTPFQRPINQDARVSHVLFAGNLILTKRDVHGRITDFVDTA